MGVKGQDKQMPEFIHCFMKYIYLVNAATLRYVGSEVAVTTIDQTMRG